MQYNIIVYIMKSPKIRIFSSISPILSLLLYSCSCLLTETATYTVYLSHLYKIDPLANDNALCVNLQWDDSTTVLNVYYYSPYQNAIYNVYMPPNAQIRTDNSLFTFINVHDSVVTQYYVRVKVVTQGQALVKYNLTLWTTSPYSTHTYIGWFSNLYGLSQQFVIPFSQYINSQQTYSFSTTQGLIAMLGNDKYGNKTFSIDTNQSFCLPLDISNNNNWVIAFAGNLSGKSDIQTYQFTLYTDSGSKNCSACSVLSGWDISNNNCVSSNTSVNTNNTTNNNTINGPQSSRSNIGVIIGVSVGGSIFLIILVVITIVLCRRCKFKEVEVPVTPIQTMKGSDTQQNLCVEDEKKYNYCNSASIDENIECPICLQKKCSVLLLCKHALHKHCIDSWMKRDNKCPVCRTEVTKGKREA